MADIHPAIETPALEYGYEAVSNSMIALTGVASVAATAASTSQQKGIINMPTGSSNDGFIQIKIGSTVKSLFFYAKVKDVALKKIGSEWREEFTIVDYFEKGFNKKASIKAISQSSSSGSRFQPITYLPGAKVRFNLTSNLLTIDGTSISAKTGTAKDPVHGLPELTPGTYNILLPNFPHSLGDGYLSHSPYARVWFPIDDIYLDKKVRNPSTGVDEFVGRYLHVGSVSHSCVTVGELASANGQPTDKQTWTKIYEHLILCRKGNKHVGELIISR